MKSIHFIAIGGAIMHQLALALHRQGYQVTGSDDEITDPARTNLATAGLLPARFGWFPEKIVPTGGPRPDVVVLGMHAREDNPELMAALEAGIPVYSFPQYVYEVSKDKKRVVIAGSHGKTTVTSMVMHILRRQGLDFDYLVGARVEGFDQSVRLSDAPLIVLEGDEYPASVIEKRPKIFFYHPHITVLTGIAWDHINVFPNYPIYFSQFEIFLHGLEPNTQLIYNAEDPEVERAVANSAGHLDKIPYGTPAYHYQNGIALVETAAGPSPVSVFGRHNLQNMEAAITVCRQLGISEDDCYEAIKTFSGAAKRLEKISETEDLVVFRDFAHAPSKLKATLSAVREAYPDHYILACFELHTFSSLNREFLVEYAHTMDPADTAIVYVSSHALELKGMPRLDPQLVISSFARPGLLCLENAGTLRDTVTQTLSALQRPAVLLLMSSGTFDGIDWNTLSSQAITQKDNA